MTEETKIHNTRSRRAFLKGAGVASVAGVAAAAASLVVAGEVEATEVPTKKAAGYSETDSVRSYYEAARF